MAKMILLLIGGTVCFDMVQRATSLGVIRLRTVMKFYTSETANYVTINILGQLSANPFVIGYTAPKFSLDAVAPASFIRSFPFSHDRCNAAFHASRMDSIHVAVGPSAPQVHRYASVFP